MSDTAISLEHFDELLHAFATAADLLDPPNTSDWKALPHFPVPPLPWYLYMMLGGRGSGKTEHATHYVHEHVYGPPCLPHVPGGHWIGIVAPTLGDAVTSCVEGPSGLRKFDPGIKVLNRPGGIIARWSNGCEAKLFGAHTPDDVERFRAGGNRCLAGDTPVEVIRQGIPTTVPIREVTTNDLALTREGYLPIARSWMISPSEQIWEVTMSDGTVAECTSDHRWPTTAGIRTTDQLTPGAILYTWTREQELMACRFPLENPSCLTEQNTICGPVVTIGPKTARHCTVRFARKPLETSTDLMFTTRRQSTTIAWVSLRFSQRMSTPSATRIGKQPGTERSSQEFANGSNVKRNSSLSGQLLELAQEPGGSALSCVAIKRAHQKERPGANGHILAPVAVRQLKTRTIAVRHATTKPGRLTTEIARRVETHCRDFANGSAVVTAIQERSSRLSRVKVAETPQPQGVTVQSVVSTERREPVYCLSIPGPHEFIIHRQVVTSNCLVLMEEFAAWRYLSEAWEQIRYGLRSGPQPRAVASTTPRTKKLIKDLVKQSKEPDSRIIIQHGRMDDNPHLNTDVKKALRDSYEGTRMGRQELEGELLEDIEGALWDGETIDKWRIPEKEKPEEFDRIIVAIDPAASATGDEHGIVVVGIKYEWKDYSTWVQYPDLSHGFVLEDCSLSGKPNKWGKRAIKAYRDWGADCMVAEVNNGGDMVEHVILGIDDGVPVIKVHASKGKAKRAEPVANLYSQGRVHHVGMFPVLEDQMTLYDPIDIDDSWSPDHMDALVWAITEGMLEGHRIHQAKPQDDRLKGRR